MGRPGCISHPKVARAMRLAKACRAVIAGSLEMIWQTGWAAGSPLIGDAMDVEAAAEWVGKSGVLFKALLECGITNEDGSRGAGFIEPVPGNSSVYQIHDFFDHAPEYVTRRRQSEGERKKPKVCEHCTEEYRSPRSDTRFCSDACRAANHRRDKNRNESVTDGVTDSNEHHKRNDTFCNAPQPNQPTQPTHSDHNNPTNPPHSNGEANNGEGNGNNIPVALPGFSA